MNPVTRALRGPRSPLVEFAILGVGAALLGGCFSGAFLSGKSCQTNDECGPSLECVNGHCGGVAPDTTAGPSGTTEGSTSSDATSTSTTSTATSEPATTDPVTTSDTDTTTTTSTTGTTDETTGATCSCAELDILVIFDQSQSMEIFEDKVVDVFIELFGVIESAIMDVCDYHIGFTFASEIGHNPPECQGVGSLLTHNDGTDCSTLFMGGRPYVSPDDDLGDALFCVAAAGSTNIPGEQNPRPAETILTALSPEFNAPGGCNEGFFRSEAPLALLVITDVDDDMDGHPMGFGSPEDPSDWFGDLLVLNGVNPDVMSIGALIGPQSMAPGCMAGPTPRLHEFIGLFVDNNTVIVNICDESSVITDEFVGGIQLLFDTVCSA